MSNFIIIKFNFLKWFVGYAYIHVNDFSCSIMEEVYVYHINNSKIVIGCSYETKIYASRKCFDLTICNTIFHFLSVLFNAFFP